MTTFLHAELKRKEMGTDKEIQSLASMPSSKEIVFAYYMRQIQKATCPVILPTKLARTYGEKAALQVTTTNLRTGSFKFAIDFMEGTLYEDVPIYDGNPSSLQALPPQIALRVAYVLWLNLGRPDSVPVTNIDLEHLKRAMKIPLSLDHIAQFNALLDRFNLGVASSGEIPSDKMFLLTNHAILRAAASPLLDLKLEMCDNASLLINLEFLDTVDELIFSAYESNTLLPEFVAQCAAIVEYIREYTSSSRASDTQGGEKKNPRIGDADDDT
jgi:hypothetical protein